LPNTYNATKQNVGEDSLDSDANKDGIIRVDNATQNNYTYDVGIYCDCDDYKVNPDQHKDLKMPAFNIAGVLVMILAIFTIARRED